MGSAAVAATAAAATGVEHDEAHAYDHVSEEGEAFDTMVIDALDLSTFPEGMDESTEDLSGLRQVGEANDASRANEATDRASHLRLRPLAGVEIVQRFLEEIGSAQLTLTMRLYELDRSMSGIAERKATRVASTTLAARVAEVETLRDALNDLYMAAASAEVAGALAHDGAFTEYLRGVYAWAESVLRALSILCTELCALAPDWFRLRARLADANDFYLGDLEPDVMQAVRALRRGPNGSHATTRELEEGVESVLIAAGRLYKGLAKRFG